jgi:hypothetical protein
MDVLRQAFGEEATIFLLRYFKDKFAHVLQITMFSSLLRAAGTEDG